MVQQGVNGLLFKNGDYKDILSRLKMLVDALELLATLSKNSIEPLSMEHVGELIFKQYLIVLNQN